MPWVAGDPIRIVIPGIPRPLERNRHRIVTPKGRPSFVANYLPAQSAREQSVIRKIAYDAMDGRAPIDGPLELRFVAYMGIAASWSRIKTADAITDRIRPTARPDLSNLIKQCEDAMNEIVYRDDSLITDCHLYKRFSDRPRLVIEVRSLTWVP